MSTQRKNNLTPKGDAILVQDYYLTELYHKRQCQTSKMVLQESQLTESKWPVYKGKF